jgi:CRP-like cAMP-binding protein
MGLSLGTALAGRLRCSCGGFAADVDDQRIVMLESPTVTMLRRVAGLRYLCPEDLTTLADAALELSAPAGVVIQQAGDAAATVRLVVDGVASVWRDDDKIGEIGAGEFIANRPPLDVLTRGARVVAETPMRLLALQTELLSGMLSETAVTATVLQSALARLRRSELSRSDESSSSAS